MDNAQLQTLNSICAKCGGRCCYYTRPPLTEERISVLVDNGISLDDIRWGKYRALELKSTGFCKGYQDGSCRFNGTKPELCAAGPFIFDIKDDKLEIFIKKDRLCPLASYLKSHPDEFKQKYNSAVYHIVKFVRALPEEELVEVLKQEKPESEKVDEIPLAEVNRGDCGNRA